MISDNDDKFPYLRMFVGPLLGSIFAWTNLNNANIIDGRLIYNIPLWAFLFIGLVVSFIPIWLAFYFNKKHKQAIYWLVFIGISLPSIGMVFYIVGLLWLLFDKTKVKSKK